MGLVRTVPVILFFLLVFPLVFLMSLGQSASAQMLPFSFFKPRPAGGPVLAYTTSAHTLATTWLCSGVVTVQAQVGGSPDPVASDTVVALGALANFEYFSDSTCATKITSITITTGNSSANFYVRGYRTGDYNMQASSAGYTSGSQTTTVSALINMTWIGGTSAVWTLGANWSGGVAPTTTSHVYFDNNCTTNCSPTLPNANLSVYSVNIASNYPGTIAQNGAYTITVSSAVATNAWRQHGGTFTGSSANMTLAGLILTGGTFNATSGIINISYDAGLYISNSATFNAGTGTVTLGRGSTSYVPGNAQFYNLNYGDNDNGQYISITGTLYVNNTLTFYTPSNGGCQSGEIRAKKNVVVTSHGGGGTGCLLRLVGDAGVTQTISGSPTNALLPSLIIETDGTVDYAPGVTLRVNGSFEYIKGSVTWTYPTFRVGPHVNRGVDFKPNGLSFQNLELSLANGTTGQFYGTANVLGDFTYSTGGCSSCPGGIQSNSGVINLSGNAFEDFSAGGGFHPLIKFIGGSTKQLTSVYGKLENIEVANSTTVELQSAVATLTSIDVSSGHLKMMGYNLASTAVTLNGNTLTKGGGTLTVNSVVQGTGSILGGTVAP